MRTSEARTKKQNERSEESTYAEESKAVNLVIALLHSIRIEGESISRARGRVSAKELSQLLLLLIIVGRVPGDVGGASVEQVGDVHLVLVVAVAVCEDVGALDGLGEVAKDVVDDDDGIFGVIRTSDVCTKPSVSQDFISTYDLPRQIVLSSLGGVLTSLVVANGLVLALFLVALGNDGGEVAAGFGVAACSLHGGHSRHVNKKLGNKIDTIKLRNPSN